MKSFYALFQGGIATQGPGRRPIWVISLMTACLLASCATHEANNNSAPEPGSGIVEYREITYEALKSIHAALDELETVSAQANPCPTNIIDAFTQQVLHLQASSVRVRARVQTIEARGDAYFATWSESIARIKNPEVRASAERHHPQLQQAFSSIKLASQAAGAAFRPFMSGLRTLRIQLDKESGLSQDDATRQLIRTTRDHGQEVIRQLEIIRGELDSVTKMLKPAAS